MLVQPRDQIGGSVGERCLVLNNRAAITAFIDIHFNWGPFQLAHLAILNLVGLNIDIN
jgi:hypothetical protein